VRHVESTIFRRSPGPSVYTSTHLLRIRPLQHRATRWVSIQKTRPITYRAKVLGRALLAARTDINSFWMLLSVNAEVAFPSTTENLPTPAAAATLDAATAVVASVVSTFTTTVTGVSLKLVRLPLPALPLLLLILLWVPLALLLLLRIVVRSAKHVPNPT
jgi:hypothetical protein